MSHFDDQLRESGHPAEQRVAGLLFDQGAMVEWANDGPSKDLVVRVRGETHLVEVKNEDHFAKSPNICIEFYQGKIVKKPSCIAVSESTVYVHTLGPRLAVFRTQAMRQYIRANLKKKYHFQKFANADNGNGGVLIPIEDVQDQPWFDICQPETLTQSKVWRLP